MNFIDLIVVLFFLLASTIVGHFTKSTTSLGTIGYFLGNHSIHWILLMFSIVATETSALTFLSLPGFSYGGNFNFLQISLGYIIGRILVAFFLLPTYFQKGYISIYELIKDKSGLFTQKTISIIFIITRLLSDSVRLFASSIPIAITIQILLKNGNFTSFTENDTIFFSLLIMSIFTIYYSIYGGFQSIVYIDTFQFVVYIFGGLFSFYILINLIHINSLLTFSELIISSLNSGKLEIFHWSDLSSNYYFLWAILGGIFLSIGSHGVDQLFVQRLLASKNLQSAKKALITSGLVVFAQFVLFLSIGLLLFEFYKNQNLEIPNDQVFPKFILEQIPTPFLGIILSSILAASMSTLSSSINSLSLTIAVDWKLKHISNQTLSFIFGCLLFVCSIIYLFLSGTFKKSLIEIGLIIPSITSGPIIGVFIILKYLRNSGTQKIDKPLAISLLLGLLVSCYFNFYYKFIFTVSIPIGIFCTLLFFLLYNRLIYKPKH